MASHPEGETYWAIHAFEAENPDEISFNPGEAVVVLEKDDQYGDGWWQVSFSSNVACIRRIEGLSAGSQEVVTEGLGCKFV